MASPESTNPQDPDVVGHFQWRLEEQYAYFFRLCRHMSDSVLVMVEPVMTAYEQLKRMAGEQLTTSLTQVGGNEKEMETKYHLECMYFNHLARLHGGIMALSDVAIYQGQLCAAEVAKLRSGFPFSESQVAWPQPPHTGINLPHQAMGPPPVHHPPVPTSLAAYQLAALQQCFPQQSQGVPGVPSLPQQPLVPGHGSIPAYPQFTPPPSGLLTQTVAIPPDQTKRDNSSRPDSAP